LDFISERRFEAMNSSRKAFTLIELLIVVAIIAILAAIAVPNFLEAQTRAKVSRLYADFRTLATALEAYRVDEKAYPPSHGADFIEPPPARLNPLTTPVAYLTKVAPTGSPFKAPGETDYWANYPQYSTKSGLLTWTRGGAPNFAANDEGNAYLNGWYRLAAGQPADLTQTGANVFKDGPEWLILDRGPDMAYYFVWANPTWVTPTFNGGGGVAQTYDKTIVWYDPTNGTTSEGEICRSQMKSSFTR